MDAADGCPEPLEKIFQQVEEESERRAQQDEQDRLQTPLAALAEEKEMPSAETPSSERLSPGKRHRDRRRGSVSISRIGMLVEDDSKPGFSPPPTPGTPALVAIYQSQIANGSTTSVASGASAFSESNHAAHNEDPTHVTQMRHIAGKPSISSKISLSMLPRRLSRANSTSLIPKRTLGTSYANPNGNVVVGVEIQEAITIELKNSSTLQDANGVYDGRQQLVSVSRRASVSVQAQPATLRSKASASTLAGSKVEGSVSVGWLARAKLLAQKLRRGNKVTVIVS